MYVHAYMNLYRKITCARIATETLTTDEKTLNTITMTMTMNSDDVDDEYDDDDFLDLWVAIYVCDKQVIHIILCSGIRYSGH